MERISIGDKCAKAFLNSEWWNIASPEDIVNVQLFVQEVCCPSDVFREALDNVLNRAVSTEELNNSYDALCKEVLKGRSAPTEKDIERTLWPIVTNMYKLSFQRVLYSLALYPSLIILGLLMVFAAVLGNTPLVNCCRLILHSYIEDYDSLAERYKDRAKGFGYALDTLDIAKNYTNQIWKVII